MDKPKIAIITDSCADIPPELVAKHHIFVIPLKIVFHDREYSDGVDITPTELYARLPQEVPKTSLPDGATIECILRRIYAEGYEKVVAIMFSSGLSGTYQLIKHLMGECAHLEVRAFDTLSGCLGTGATVLQTAEYIEQGRPWEEILELIPRLIRNTKVFFCLDTLEYLQKGGRIGLITSIAGSMLQIKPVITFSEDGQLVNIAKVRGRKQSIEKVAELAAAQVPEGAHYNIMTAHGDAPEDGKRVHALLSKALPKHRHCYRGVVDCTLGTHTGPHLIGAGVQILDHDM